jgi:hypothetical protein
MIKWFFNCCFSEFAIFFSRQINKLLFFRQKQAIEFINCICEKQHSLPPSYRRIYDAAGILWSIWKNCFIDASFEYSLPCILIIPYGSRRFSAQKANVHQVVCWQSTKKCLLIFIWFSTWFNLVRLGVKLRIATRARENKKAKLLKYWTAASLIYTRHRENCIHKLFTTMKSENVKRAKKIRKMNF